ncbi:MAG: hypothetical protein ACO1NO_00365 [Burkholderiaceae bacterium]
MIVFVATSLTFETTGCSILPVNPLSALLLLRFLPVCGLTEFLLSAAIEGVPDRDAAVLLLSLPVLLSAFGKIGFFGSFVSFCCGLAVVFTSLTALLPALFSLVVGLAADFDAGLLAVLLTTGFACALTCLESVFDAGFSNEAFDELLDAFLGVAFAGAAFFALAVNAGFFAPALFLAEVTTVFITSLPDFPNALFHGGIALVIYYCQPPNF